MHNKCMGLYGNLSETKQGFRQSESIIFAMSKLMGGMTQLLRNLAQLSSNLAQIVRIQGSGDRLFSGKGTGWDSRCIIGFRGRFLCG